MSISIRQTYILINIVDIAEPGIEDLELHKICITQGREARFLSWLKSLSSKVSSAYHHITTQDYSPRREPYSITNSYVIMLIDNVINMSSESIKRYKC